MGLRIFPTSSTYQNLVSMSDVVATLAHVDEYLAFGQEYDASDIHLATGAQPTWRRHGQLLPIWENGAMITAEDAERLVRSFLSQKEMERLEERGDIDFAYANGNGRFRASVVRQRLGYDMVFRVISANIRSMKDLGLGEHIKRLTQFHNGLVLVTGPVGSGKSTTLAALVNEVNNERNDHIITLEDPIEYVFESAGCHVNQRELHSHTESFASALRAALREDPDVVMVGEMRDLETISLAITAAETGHLVLGTLHTGSAARTLDRILDVFPPDQRDQIRMMVSESVRGILSQQLVPRKDGSGRVMCMEVLVNNPAIAASIRDGKTFMLPGIMQVGKSQGMVTMDDALKDLVVKDVIEAEEAIQRSSDPELMRKELKALLG
jgi:twitching motility protein PilT